MTMNDLPDEERPSILGVAIAFETSLILVAALLAWMWDISPLSRVGGPGRTAEDLRAIWLGMVAVVPMLGMMLAVRLLPLPAFRKLNSLVDEVVVPLFRGVSVGSLAVISLAAGIGEEMLFRGVLFDKMTVWWGLTGAIVGTSLLFGLAHWLTMAYGLLAAGLAVYLAGLMLWTNNILAAMVAHALYDFLVLLVLVKGREPLKRTAGPAGSDSAPPTE